jgi:predicted GNAT family acetyltransferase
VAAGIGRSLVLHVLDRARERGLKVVPTCGFVATVIDENPEYQDLVAAGGRDD